MNISIIGTGYVGLVSGACFAKLGNNVICVDIDEEIVNKINNGITPIFEKDLDKLLLEHKEKINATVDIKTAIEETDITFICVGTPSKQDGSIDLCYIKEAAIEIGKQLKHKNKFHVVVVKSTVLPGTTRDVVLPLIENYSDKKAGEGFGIAMNPEFLKEGVAIDDFLNPDRIVIGYYDSKSKETLKELYSSFTCPIVQTSLSAAEMIKYASNSFLATKVSFANEIGNLCKTLGIDSYEVAQGVGYDKRIGRSFLDSGIGWGGSCFPKDLKALTNWAEKQGEKTYLINSAIEVNDIQPLKLIELLKKHIPNLNGKTIGILGLAFKPNTDDIRESRAIPIVKKLIKENTTIKVYDPKAMENFKKIFPNIIYCSKPKDVLESDAVLITTRWAEFKKLDFKENIVIDGRRLEEAKKAEVYEGVCW